MTPQELHDRLSRADRVVYDSETNGLDWRVNQIVGHVLTFGPGDSHYFPVRHLVGNRFDGDYIEAVIRHNFARHDLTIIFHNAPFDLMFLAKHDIHVSGRVHDTHIAAALVYEHERRYSLEALAQKYGCVEKKTDIYKYMSEKLGLKAERNIMGKFWYLSGNDPRVAEYAAGDGETTLELYDKLMAEIETQHLSGVWELECALTPVLHRMTRKGTKIDQERLELAAQQCEEKIIEEASKLPERINTRSPMQLEKLFKDAGFTEFIYTPIGRPSFPEAWLKKSPLGRIVVRQRRWRTLLNTFIKPLRDEHLYKGRVHSTYHQVRADEHGTISGRLSSSNPNAQNFPSPNKHPEQAKILRACFVPDDGMKMYEADLSQAEIRMFTHYAKVKTWREGYAQTPEIDAHSAVANAVGIPRQAAKVINLSLSYGAGKDKLASLLDEAGVDGSQADTYLTAYHDQLPEVRKFQKRARNLFADRGFVYSITGRRYRLADSVPYYTAVNRIIQGATADYIKRALVIANENNGGDLLNCIHDSICWQTNDEEYAKGIVEAMTERTTAYYGLSIPMRVDVGAGPNWAECHG